VERKQRIAQPEHREVFGADESKSLVRIESLFKARLFNPPSRQEVIEAVKILPENVDKSLQILIEQERLIRVENDLFFHVDAVEKAKQILIEFISKEGKLESVKFKYLLDTTRKFAIPLLDYLDRIGVTQRVGNTRYLKTHN
jgi:selenocysteine-specific elongation factor